MSWTVSHIPPWAIVITYYYFSFSNTLSFHPFPELYPVHKKFLPFSSSSRRQVGTIQISAELTVTITFISIDCVSVFILSPFSFLGRVIFSSVKTICCDCPGISWDPQCWQTTFDQNLFRLSGLLRHIWTTDKTEYTMFRCLPRSLRHSQKQKIKQRL